MVISRLAMFTFPRTCRVLLPLFTLAYLSKPLHTAATPAQIASLIPETFPDQNVEDYTVRYVSTDGNDTDSCLETQLQNKTNSCRSLRYALFGTHNRRGRHISNLIVLLKPGSYPHGRFSIVLSFFTNLVISRDPEEDEEVILHCELYPENDFNNLYITNSRFVAVHNLVFERCGPRSPGMGVRNVTVLYIANCIARNNIHSGIITLLSVNMTIYNCTFENNFNVAPYIESETLDPGEIRFSGGLSISWRNLADSTGQARIINCTFMNNTASVSPENSNDSRPSLYRPQGHGGALITYFSDTSYNRLVIEGTRFIRNRANFNGGGMFFTFNNARGNRIEILNSIFEENVCEDGIGGAISMSTFNKSNNNQVNARGCQFAFNNASIGGGACSIDIQDQLVNGNEQKISNLGNFENCVFSNNSSPEGGSAISLVSNARVDQALSPTTFTNCSFLGNEAKEEGAVRSLRFPLVLDGNTVFKENNGGGVAVLQSRMDISGTVLFEGNRADTGGAVSLRDQSVMHVLRNVNITFYKNVASYRGGAISVISPSVGLDTDIVRLFNTRCFIQYDVINTPDSTSPSLWNASFNFIGNKAMDNGAAIYATDINRCTYTPNLDTTGNTIVSEKSIFALTDRLFYFSENELTQNENKNNEDLASAPTNLIVKPLAVSGAPGEVIEFSVRAVDQSNNSRRAVWSLLDNSVRQDVTMGQDYFVLTPNGSTHHYTIHSSEGKIYSNCTADKHLHTTKIDFNLVQIIAGDIVNSSTAKVTVTCCHPGYQFNTNHSVCEYNRSDKVILRADINQRYLYIEPEHYAEYRDSGVIVSAVIPATFQKCTKQGTLRGCLFKYDDPYDQCSNNRTGFLCGNCSEGQRLDLTLRNCKTCGPEDYIILALIIVAFIIATILVLIFNIGVPNDLKGCFFFVQVVGFVYQGSSDWDFHLSRFFASFYIPVCPLTDHSAYVTAAYGLILSVIAVTAIIVYVICARFIRRLGTHSSLEGIWLLFIIMIKYAADSAFSLIRCQKVIGEHGEFVYFYDGTSKCFQYDETTTHLGFAIAAIAILVLVFGATIAILVVSYRRFEHTQAFTDILTNGIKVSCRWWSFFDLLRRLLFVVVAFLLNYIQPDYNQLAQFAVGIVIFFVFACSQPYKEKRANVIESLILLDLLILTALFLNTADESLDTVSILASVLLILPFIFAVVYIIMKIISIIWEKFAPTSFMQFCMRVRDLLMPGNWMWKTKGGISHTLELTDDISSTKDGPPPETQSEFDEFSTGYTELREDLLEPS